MHIGITEIIVIALVAMVLIRPKNVTECAESLGKAMKAFSDAKTDVNKQSAEIEEVVKEETKEIKEK